MRILVAAMLILAEMSFQTGAMAQGISAENCQTDTSGAITALGANGKCYMPADKFEFEFHFMGVCKEFPKFYDDLSNCISNEISSATVAVSKGSAVELEGMIPPSGNYDYVIAITSNRFRVEGVVKFSAALNAYGNTEFSGGIGGEMSCTAPTIDQRTSHIFSNDRPQSFITSWGTHFGLSMTRCSENDIANPSDVGAYTIDQLSQDGSFGSRKSDFSYDVDVASPVNLVLLQENNEEATSNANASRILFVTKRETIVPVGATQVRYTYSLDQGLNVWNCPLEACLPNQITAINMGNLNFRAVYE